MGWRGLALLLVVAGVGALGTLATGVAMGMHASELVHLAALLAPALVVTLVAIAVARPLLARSSMRQSLVAVAIVGAVVGLANLVVLARQMFVNDHDATTLAVLFLYSTGAGIGAALALARAQSRAVARLAETARALGEGDIDARVGTLEGGPELDTLAVTLDDMATKLQAAMERERRIERTRRDLMTAVSHDLRTPLSSLRAMVEAIEEGVIDDTPSLRLYAVEMRRSVSQLVSMVDDLFEMVQLDEGAIETETHRARLVDIVSSAVAAVEVQAREKRLSLVTNLNGAEDAPCSPRVTRVLQNLLVNAVRHTPADGTVRVRASRSLDWLEVAVEDTGEGMAPEDLAHVFEPFFRADPARSGAGAGLGLALARRIVESLGGRIEAESRPAVGSRFSVQLPP
jgi:signal transduction histidine kinase